MAENKKLLIIGDTIVDQYIFTQALGLSLESPCIKTKFINSQSMYGGAANVARIASYLGAEVSFITSVSKITEYQLSTQYQIKVINIKEPKDNIKSRYFIQKQNTIYQYLQINDCMENQQEANLVLDQDYDTIAFSDYRLGLIDQNILNIIKDKNTTTYAASQVSSNNPNFELYNWVNHIVCNEEESQYLPTLENIFVTKGHRGCSYNGKDYPAYPVSSVKQIIGAGDCFYAALLVFNDPDKANEIAAKYVAKEL
jgi:bifunctional ADP-heptose synthase (sugar kinase/adenylyltransferase)